MADPKPGTDMPAPGTLAQVIVGVTFLTAVVIAFVVNHWRLVIILEPVDRPQRTITIQPGKDGKGK